MKPLTICVPTLRRYDLLAKLANSIDYPGVFNVFDNGKCLDKVLNACKNMQIMRLSVSEPERPRSLAYAWNWFIQAVPEERLIVNDDIEFSPGDIAKILQTEGAFVSALKGSNAFSCFLIRDECVQKVGLFDEEISPDYAYFEDCDYAFRMEAAGIPITDVSCGVRHLGSQTLKSASPEQEAEHHKRWAQAKKNFVKKHGRLPLGMEA